MSNEQPVIVGGRLFVSKAALQREIRMIVQRWPDDVPITDPGDGRLVCDLLRLHPRRDEKIGCGVTEVFVRTNEYEGRRTRGFWLRRRDGSETDWSWVVCLTPPDHRSDVLAALRHAIAPDAMRVVERQRKCAFCRKEGPGMQADHAVVPFVEIASDFADLSGGWDAIEIIRKDRALHDTLADPNIEQQWLAWHRKHVNWQVLCEPCNLSKGAR